MACGGLQNVAKTGRQEFRRAMQAHADLIKEQLRTNLFIDASYIDFWSMFSAACLLAEYRGAVHPLRGDEPSRRVRDAAKVRCAILTHVLFLSYDSLI